MNHYMSLSSVIVSIGALNPSTVEAGQYAYCIGLLMDQTNSEAEPVDVSFALRTFSADSGAISMLLPADNSCYLKAVSNSTEVATYQRCTTRLVSTKNQTRSPVQVLVLIHPLSRPLNRHRDLTPSYTPEPTPNKERVPAGVVAGPGSAGLWSQRESQHSSTSSSGKRSRNNENHNCGTGLNRK